MSALKEKTIYSDELEITPHTAWSQIFWDELTPAKNRVSEHPLFKNMADGSLSLVCFQHALLNFAPLVLHFPSYMALSLSKAIGFHQPGITEARNWLIQNIKVEERHLAWYRDWATGFGLTAEALDTVCPPPAMDAVNHYLWSVGHRGSLAEGIAATNLAIEWATGDWSKQVYKGIQAYQDHPDIHINKRTLAWLRAHSMYDDMHPYEAMELVKRLCDHDATLQQKALQAAKQGLAYYELALDDCYKIHLSNS